MPPIPTFSKQRPGERLAALMVGLRSRKRIRRKTGSKTDASIQYPPSEIGETARVSHFSLDYARARESFRDAAQVAGANMVATQTHPTALGPNGEALSIDVARLGPEDAKDFLVIVSGTHGVEGFAGSAIQVGLLRERILSGSCKGVGILLIHALNPYGMAHGRRFNEDNIDLNRNFRSEDEPPRENPYYGDLASAIAPKSVSLKTEIGSWLRILLFAIRHGKTAAQATLSQGQYVDAEGLFFGGKSESWSAATLRSITERYLADADRVVVVDVHTGLGAFGDYEIILHDSVDSEFYRWAIDIWGETRVKSTLSSGNGRGRSASAHITGTIKLGFTQLPNVRTLAVGLEFGTLPPMRVFKALRAENVLHHHGNASDSHVAAIKESLLRAFYPDSPEWKASIWNRGRDVIESALNWLKKNPV